MLWLVSGAQIITIQLNFGISLTPGLNLCEHCYQIAENNTMAQETNSHYAIENHEEEWQSRQKLSWSQEFELVQAVSKWSQIRSNHQDFWQKSKVFFEE